MSRLWTVSAVVDRMKQEILDDVRAGVVPSTVASFSELHDSVDANGYGGFFDGDAPEMTEKCDGELDATDVFNAASDQVDAWIKEGGVIAVFKNL